MDRPNAKGQPEGPRRGDHVYDVPICDGLKAILRDQPSFLDTCRNADGKWADMKPGDSVEAYCDITDGSIFRAHPELGVDADRSDGAVRLAFILYYDEVEVTNALGAFTGTHKLGLFYWALINLPPGERMNLCNIHLATIVLDADMKYYGPEQIVSGPPNEPNYPQGSSIGASLRALNEGITLHEPRGGQFVDVLTRGWLVVVSADFPAAALLTGTMVGVSANMFCRQCCVDRRKKGFDDPCSFRNPTAETPSTRTLEQRQADMAKCKNDAKAMASAGWTSWENAFERVGPHFDFMQQVPYDLMHVEAEGLLKGECACFIFYCVRVKEWFTLDDLNRALDGYKFPGGGKQIPYFMDAITKGKSAAEQEEKRAKKQKRDAEELIDGPQYIPASGAHVHMTAGQMLTFAAHSPQIFLDLGVDQDDPAFAAWRTHLTYLNIVMQTSVTADDIKVVDALIQTHQRQLKQLSAIYPDIWKPKHHYSLHFASDMKKFGPLRHYWCMRFEALNQLFKKIAVGGSYRDTTRRCATFWCMRSALARQRQSWTDWEATRVLSQSDTVQYRCDSAGLPPHIQQTLGQWSACFGSMISTSYIYHLSHEGHHIYAGTSWLILQLDTGSDSNLLLASVKPLTGMFAVDGGYFFDIAVYHGITIPTATPQRVIEIPLNALITDEVISLDEIVKMTVLWPQQQRPHNSGTLWTFIDM